MAIKGTVRYPGYATDGVVKQKGMKNKRKKKKARLKRIEVAKARQAELDRKRREYSSFQDFSEFGF